MSHFLGFFHRMMASHRVWAVVCFSTVGTLGLLLLRPHGLQPAPQRPCPEQWPHGRTGLSVFDLASAGVTAPPTPACCPLIAFQPVLFFIWRSYSQKLAWGRYNWILCFSLSFNAWTVKAPWVAFADDAAEIWLLFWSQTSSQKLVPVKFLWTCILGPRAVALTSMMPCSICRCLL